MLSEHQFVPNPQMLLITHFKQPQSSHFLEFFRNTVGLGNPTLQSARTPSPPTREEGLGEFPQALLGQLPKGFGGGGHLPVSFGVAQIQLTTELFSQTVASRCRLSPQQGEHQFGVLGL